MKMLILPNPNAVVSYLGLIHKFSKFFLLNHKNSLNSTLALLNPEWGLETFFFLKINK